MYDCDVGQRIVEVGSAGTQSVSAWPYAVYPPPPTMFYEQRWRFNVGPLVYFALDRDLKIKYVGSTSKQLNDRLKSHQVVTERDLIGWLCFSKEDYKFAEAFYIGVLRPYGNSESTEKKRFAPIVSEEFFGLDSRRIGP